MDIKVLFHAQAVIGEQPTWVEDEGAIYMMDVRRRLLRRLTLAGAETGLWSLPDEIGAFALGPEGSGFALVALRTGLHRLDLASGLCELLEPPPFDPDAMRFNEGALDPEGRFWIGSMFDPRPGVERSHRAAPLHSYTLGGGLRVEPDLSDLHNGMGFSPDGALFYLCHTHERRILAFERDAAAGALTTPARIFVDVEAGIGSPDGAAVDVDGGYWCALHGGGRLRRYDASGRLDQEIPLPVSQPTMCAFAGPGLETLVITTARQRLTPEALAREPDAGAVLTLRPGIRGARRRARLPSAGP